MPDDDGTCEYVLNPQDAETWGGAKDDLCLVDRGLMNEEGVWPCPHDAKEGKDLCIFHLPLTEKDDADVIEAFQDALDEAAGSDDPEVRNRKLQFLNATFGEFDLSENPPDIAVEFGWLALDYAIIAGEIDWSSTAFDIPSTTLVEAQFNGDADFGGAEFGGVADFGDVEFGGGANFGNVEFGGRTNFKNAEFGGETDFRGAEFGGDAHFGDVEFGGETDFMAAEFEEDCNFRALNLDGSRFDYADLTDSIFVETSLRGASFEAALLSRATLFGADLRGAKLNGAVLGDIRIDKDTQFLGHSTDEDNTSPRLN